MILNEHVNLAKHSYLVCFAGVVVLCYHLPLLSAEVGVYSGVDLALLLVCLPNVPQQRQ